MTKFVVQIGSKVQLLKGNKEHNYVTNCEMSFPEPDLQCIEEVNGNTKYVFHNVNGESTYIVDFNSVQVKYN